VRVVLTVLMVLLTTLTVPPQGEAGEAVAVPVRPLAVARRRAWTARPSTALQRLEATRMVFWA
jgi:hypothetical protein